MKLQPPVEVSTNTISFDVSEIEPLLQAPPMKLPPLARSTDHPA